MKYIIKGNEPEIFTNWKKEANEYWTPTYDDLSGNVKTAVFSSLKNEQGKLCCYCERELKENDYHIEHLKPKDKDKFPELQLEYSNFLCSCQRNIKKGIPRHCGNSKDNWYTENELVSPLNSDCEKRFKYTGDGQIFPANEKDAAARMTIEKLQLHIEKLNNLRKNAIEPFLDENLSQDELDSFVQEYLKDKNQNNGIFNEFYTTIKYLFGK